MSFYEFRQSNSGGSFKFDHKRGLSVHVWVEASSAEEANALAENLGIYFDGYGDCSCCGDRWHEAYESDAVAEVPEQVTGWTGWAPDGVSEGYVHFLDGRVRPLPFVKS
jgi:hypothetical protein